MTAPAESQYQQALVQAAALYAAAKTAPDPIRQLATAVAVSARALRQAEDAALAAITGLWRTTNPYDDRAVTAFARDGGQVMLQAQRTVAQITASSRTQQLRLSSVNVTVSPRIPDNVRGTSSETGKVTVAYADAKDRKVSRADSGTARVLERVAKEYRYQTSRGKPHPDALDAADRRLAAIVDGNLQRARVIVEERSIQQAAEATTDLDRKVVGYRRVIHPEMSKGGVCGLCVVAADREYKVGDLKAIHNGCKCTVMEIFDDFDPGHELNGRDLDAIYKAAGGNTRQVLKRVRYKLVDHEELGLQLVGSKGAPIPYFAAPEPN